jgi:hypothetical protein
MGHEFPALCFETHFLANSFLRLLESAQFSAFFNMGDNGVRLVASENADAAERQREGPHFHPVENQSEIAPQCVVDIAHKSQGDMEGFPVNPPRTHNPALHEIQIEGHIRWKFNPGEQAHHGGASFVS